ncbi:hypothetical protein RB201_05065 [Streptomyces sp. S1A(2023)]
MTLAIIGATGKLGTLTVDALLERGVPAGAQLEDRMQTPARDCKTIGATPEQGRCIDDQRQRDRGRVRQGR